MGYGNVEIFSTLIRAISRSNNLRSYLESSSEQKISLLIGILISHYNEKDPTSTEFFNTSEGKNESCIDFVV